MALAKVLLSGSTGGKGIKVVATATAGTTIHTTGISASVFDEVWLYAYNDDSSAATLTIEWGGVTDPDNTIVLTVPAGAGLTLAVPGTVIVGDGAAGRTVAAFASVANKVVIYGYVNRIS